jgi:hypothetical protein
MDCLRKEYVNYINNKREKIISEEMMLKYYFAIKKVKENLIASANAKIYETSNANNNINNSIIGNGNFNNSSFSQKIVSKRTFNSNFSEKSDKDKEFNLETEDINDIYNDEEDYYNKKRRKKIGVSHIKIKSKGNNGKKIKIKNNYV